MLNAIWASAKAHSGKRHVMNNPCRDCAEWQELARETERLRTAAERVCSLDWSDNDRDEVEAIEALRAALK